MAILNILKNNDPTLRKTCREVSEITPRIITLLDDMAQTMRAANGCGLAGPQVGVLRRIVVIETEESGLIELINPKIIAYSGKQNEAEGCLSVPGRWGIVDRPLHVTVKALNRHGEEITLTGTDLLARAFCHELDHLDGVLFTDKAIRMLSRDEIEEG